jgi:DNA-binding transcriptional LysR family regulator
MEDRLQVSQIKYFLALCDHRSFSRAAKACGVSQPSLSNAIRRLENTLGGKLVERGPFALTPLGRSVRPHFRVALRHILRAHSISKVQEHRNNVHLLHAPNSLVGRISERLMAAEQLDLRAARPQRAPMVTQKRESIAE